MTKEVIYRAGFIPYRLVDKGVEFLFMRPSDAKYGGDQFQIAKGKVETGEDDLDAAIREASEELGLIPESLLNTNYLGRYLGRMAVFVGLVAPSASFGQPHFETGETKWLTLEEYAKIGRELQLPIVNDAHKMINHWPHMTGK